MHCSSVCDCSKLVGSPCSMSHHAKCARSFQVQSRQDNHLKKIFCASSHRCGLFVVWNNQHFSDAQHTTKEAKDSRDLQKNTFHLLLRIFYHILRKQNPFCKVPTSEYACRHAQIDLFTSRKWIRVGISTLQPLKVQGGQNSIFFPGLQNLNLNFRTEKGILQITSFVFSRKKSVLNLAPKILVKLRIFKPKIIRLIELEFSRKKMNF